MSDLLLLSYLTILLYTLLTYVGQKDDIDIRSIYSRGAAHLCLVWL